MGGETVLIPVRRSVADLGSVYVLSEVAGWLWDRMAEPTSTAALADALVAEFDVAPEQAAADVAALVDDLLGERLLRPVAGAP